MLCGLYGCDARDVQLHQMGRVGPCQSTADKAVHTVRLAIAGLHIGIGLTLWRPYTRRGTC